MLDMTPDAVRSVTLADFQSPDPDVQTMALMQIFPNLVYFDKADFGYEHYLTRDAARRSTPNGDGIIDAGQDFLFDMFGAANAGLQQFVGFNGPMGFPADYEWYPPFEDVSDVISMKLPDGSLMKMFLQMQAATAAAGAAAARSSTRSRTTRRSRRSPWAATAWCRRRRRSAPAAASTATVPRRRRSAAPMPVGQKVPVDMGPMGTLEMPVYQLEVLQRAASSSTSVSTTTCEEIVAGTARRRHRRRHDLPARERHARSS